jgi:hypothetical protein
MLNNLKQAVRKKKLYFTVRYSVKNVNELSRLLTAKLVLSFVSFKQSSIIVWINYSNDFSASATSISTNSKKLSKQQNKIVNNFFLDSNFIINIGSAIKGKKVKKPDYFVKFR